MKICQTALLMILACPSLAWGASGSDRHYIYKNVDESDGPAYAGYNPASSGAAPLALGTGASLTFTLPFTFSFYGTDWSQVTLHAYGVVSMGSGSLAPGAYSTSRCVGDGSVSGSFVAPYWFNWDLDAFGRVYYESYPNAVYFFWDDLRTGSGDTADTSFGVWLFESGEIVFVYENTATGSSASSSGRMGAIGIQAGTSLGLNVGCRTAVLNDSEDTFYFTPWGLRHFSGQFRTSDASVATFWGSARSDWFGRAASSAGDLDGDAIDDILVGAPYNDATAGAAGAAYVFRGSSGLSGTYAHSTAWSTILGAAYEDQAGLAVAGNGDFDGDGLDDIVVGAPYTDSPSSAAGSAAVFLNGSLSSSLSYSSGDAIFRGTSSGDHAGFALSFVGDIDDDGYDDLLVGAPENDSAASNAGAVYLVRGPYEGTASLASADSVLLGVNTSDAAGYRVGSAGDVDGDGLPDLLVGAPGWDGGGTNSGGYFVVTAATLAAGSSSLARYTTISGSAANDSAGLGMSSAGDLDDDGFDDLFLGAYSTGTTAGQAYYLRNSDGSLPTRLSSAHTIFAGDATDRMGFALTAMQFGSEAPGALAVGSYGASDGASNAGAIYFFDREAVLEGGTWNDEDARGSLLPAGSLASAHVGFAMSAGDFDGDGFEDVLTGAYEGDGSAADSGTAYVLLGRPTYPDADGDGFIGQHLGGPDCDDSSRSIRPGATERCDGVDNDCDGTVDEGFGDSDEDGIADCLDVETCDGLDNDGDGSVDEGMSDVDDDGICDLLDTETCDGVDNDGDGSVDEGFPDTDRDGTADCVDVETCDGLDNDGDGSVDEGYPDTDGDGTADCVDVETCDGLDNDGDGSIDEGFPDTDRDGTADCMDVEECDGLDNDGNRLVDEGYPDTDGDGTADCVDVETCDGLDNDGDTEIDEGYPDTDGDGTADCVDVEECDGLDNDGDGEVDEGYPDIDHDGIPDCVSDEACDGVDNDGDGDVDEGYPDTDGDGTADCVDVEECDGFDNDGDGDVDEGYPDTDGDGIADCVDPEECDGLDNDGDGDVDEGFADADGDGVADCVDDDDPGVKPPGDKPCGCASTGPTGAGFLSLFLLPLLVRRRGRGKQD